MPSPVSAFSIPPCPLIDTDAPKTMHPSCGADTAPSRLGAGHSIRFPARHKTAQFLPWRFILDNTHTGSGGHPARP
jgi:hypothetical protein